MEKRGTKRPYDNKDENKAEVGVKVLYFDLETTGLNGQICSMAFLSSNGGRKFSKFLIPKCSFHPGATMKNKMTLLSGKLHHNGKIVESAVPIEDGLQHFVDWLKKLIKKYGKIIMVSTYDLCAKHIIKLLFFDCKVIVVVLEVFFLISSCHFSHLRKPDYLSAYSNSFHAILH